MSHVVIAMSGGVDSSVAAALLKAQGHAVTGMMLRLWSEPGREDENRCCSPHAMRLARRAAAVLEIPFYVVDAQDAFRRHVVQYFLDGYAAGHTPNPCLECNRLLKWNLLLEQARDQGAQLLATGHYVRLKKDAAGRTRILRAFDRSKDQSYVLYWMTQELLAHSLFPVGEYSKEEIRALAQDLHLPGAQRADSQDLCFLGGQDYRTFLRRHAPHSLRPGPIFDRQGVLVGQHNGLADYTIGQRKGIPVQAGEPLYVLAKQADRNALIVGPRHALGASQCSVSALNWVSGEAPASPFRAWVKTRYTAKEVPAEVSLLEEGRSARVHFDEAVRDLTPGQAAVFYDGEVMLGGGLIQAGN